MARRNDHTREELEEMAVTIAEQLVSRHGIAGVSARKIAGEMGYTAGTLYLLFRNIDWLIIEVNLRTLRQMEAQIKSDMNDKMTSAEMIHAIAKSYYHYAITKTQRWRTLFEHDLPEGELFPERYHQQVNQLFALVEAPLQEIFGTASKSEITKEVRALWASVHGLTTLAILDKLNLINEDPHVILEMLVDRLIDHDNRKAANA